MAEIIQAVSAASIFAAVPSASAGEAAKARLSTAVKAALATPDLIRGSGQRGNSMVRAQPISGLPEIGHVKERKSGKPDLRCASSDARERAGDTRPEPGSSARATLRLTIEDDGCGFDVSPARERAGERKGCLGLAGMRERLALIGGGLEIESAVGGGTTIFARIPIEPERMTA